jgi:hypothetical protein
MVGFKGLLSRLPNPLTGAYIQSSTHEGGLKTAKETELFTKTDPAVDGEECTHDCSSCSVEYPAKFKVEQDAQLYGHIKAFDRHLLIATGKSDWVCLTSFSSIFEK